MKRILVVDDELFFRELFHDYLTANPEWEVEVAGGAEEALTRFERGGIDLVISDLVMTGTDGLQLVAALRERKPELPVVVVTQRDDVKAAVDALRLGVNEYLIKPVDREMLHLALARAFATTGLRRAAERLEKVEEEYLASERLYRACLQLVEETDPLRLQDAILEQLTRLTQAQGAALWFGPGDGKRPFALLAHAGVVDHEALPSSFDLSEDTPAAARLREQAAYVEGSERLLLPLIVGARPVGVVRLSDKLSGDFDERDVIRARTVANFAAASLSNARRFAQLQRVGLRDRDTAAYNLTYFIDYAGKEIYKARRYRRAFSLVSLQVDNLGLIRRALPADTTRTIHRALIQAAQAVIRDSDILAKVTDDTFYLLLPETDYFGAIMFARRALAGFRTAPVIERLSVPPMMVVGCAAFPSDGDDFDELIHQCRRRQDEVRASPYRKLHLEGHGFWDLFEALHQAPEATVASGNAGRRCGLDGTTRQVLLAEVARKLERETAVRGLVYYGAPRIDGEIPLVAGLEPGEKFETQVYLLGRSVIDCPDRTSVTAVNLPDERRLEDRHFLLILTETAHYAWLEQGKTVYQTSDSTLVQALVARIQETYDLQRHL
ncbi:MAG: response regulator [Deltaproteobacteria bacterium]|nr:response regulator [Deltaproteobacteria bacterium]